MGNEIPETEIAGLLASYEADEVVMVNGDDGYENRTIPRKKPLPWQKLYK